MLFGLSPIQPIYLVKCCGFFVVFPIFVFLFVVVRLIIDNDRSQLLFQDVKLYLNEDFSV